MEFLVGILILVLLVRWGVLSARLREIEQHRLAHENQLASLTRRVRELEVGRVAPAMPPPVPAAAPPPLPATPLPAPAPLSAKPVGAVLDPSRVTHTPPPLPLPPPPRLPVAPAPEPVHPRKLPTSDWRDRLREKAGSQEWEAMVGGNWLNKLGVLVLVIGIALFLGYEFTRVGPAGRVAIGAAVSLTMLLGGVLLERRPLYKIFGRGLIGGGWAALYFTTFAMHAVPAARVIENAYLGSAALLAVALGMILHSLRYRSQTVSGLAYFIAFATLGLSESTTFSVLALIPLAASLLILAYRFDWRKMAVFGVVATYATCATRPDTGAPLASTQALFAVYWLLFESFDLLRLRRRERGFNIESLIAPLNALGFLGLSAVKWQRSATEHLYAFLAAGAALYLASALLRVRISPPSSFAEKTGTGTRIAAGSYEGPLTLAALLAALAIFRKLAGVWLQVGLLIEGEALFLAGLQFGQTYLRRLAGAVFGASVIQLAASEVPEGGTIVIAGRPWMLWSPVASLTAGVFYLNRILRLAEGAVYSSAAAGLITLVLGFETPRQYLCVSWLVFAALLFEFGFRKGKVEFRAQAYAVGLLGTGAGVRLNVLAGPLDRQWVPIAVSGAIHYAAALRIRFGGIERLKPDERDMVPLVTSASATAFFAALVWKLAPAGYLGVAWLALGAVLFELGLRNLPKHFRWQSYVVSLLGFFHLFYFRVMPAEKGAGRAEWLSLTLAALICYSVSARLLRSAADRIEDQERGWARDWNAAAGTLFVLTLAWVELPDVLVALAWAVVSLVLLEAGFSVSLVSFRTLGNLTAAAVFGRLFLANFTSFGNTAGISHRLLTVVPIIGAQYYVWSRYRRGSGWESSGWESRVARLYLYAPAILGVVLLRFELGRSLAVVGWALFGLALYRTGLVRDLVDLRRQSYVIAALAFWRSWNTNFYIPESLAGVSGRVLTGAVVVASFYVAQLMAPRVSPRESPREARLARTFYSLLASVLLAVLLFYEVSGGLLTVAWGVEALALLGAGFPLRDRFQRLSGLFLFLICVLKLFLYDLRQLETINRILSFIALGLILVSVSWIYTRFRSRLQRYL